MLDARKKIKIRQLENFHIFLWLLKDLSWLIGFKFLGILMIFPAIGFAGFIAYLTQKNFRQFSHNLAVVFWIIANSCWMVLEFFAHEEYKNYVAIPFIIGLAVIGNYYLQLILRR